MADDKETGRSPDIEAVRERLRAVLQSVAKKYPEERKRAEDAAKGGLVARIIGDAPNHAGAIAFVSVLGLLLLLGFTLYALLYADGENAASYVDDVKSISQSLMTLIGTILGYLFGRSGGDKAQ